MTFEDKKPVSPVTNPADPNTAGQTPSDPNPALGSTTIGGTQPQSPTQDQTVSALGGTSPSPAQGTDTPSTFGTSTPAPAMPEDISSAGTTPSQIGTDILDKAEDSSMVSPSGDTAAQDSPTAQNIPEGVDTNVAAPQGTAGASPVIDENKDAASPVEPPAGADSNVPKSPV